MRVYYDRDADVGRLCFLSASSEEDQSDQGGYAEGQLSHFLLLTVMWC